MNDRSARNLTLDLSEHALIRPQSPAVVLGDRVISYGELDDCVWRTVRWLRDAEIRPGMIVGLIMADQIALLLAMLGLMRLGATAFPLSPNAPTLQQDNLLREAGASAILSDAPAFATTTCRFVGFSEEHARRVSRDGGGAFGDSSAPCLLLSGSGTTGRPRLIPISHGAMLARSSIGRQIYSMTISDRLMVMSRLHFAMAIRPMLAAFSVGSIGILYNQRDSLGSAIIAMMPDILLLSVSHAEQLLKDRLDGQLIDFSAIRMVSIGASTVTQDLRRRMREDLKANLHIEYGSNENSTITIANPADLADCPGSVGRPPLGVQVEVVDDSGQPVAVGQVGQVRVKSPAQIRGYYLSDDSEHFRDGWFYPGDLAMWSADGQLFHCGRADQMMIMNGINIYPAEIERVLEQHPAVRDVIAFPLKHPRAQDIPACAVVLHPGTPTARDELDAFSRQRLGARTPRFIVILEAIPRNQQGKPQRAELMRLVETQLRQPSPVPPPSAPPAASHDDALAAERSLRQLTRRVSLDFQPPGVLQPGAIDAWLVILNPHIGASRSAPSPTATKPLDMRITEWLERVTLLARELLQVAQMPVFDAPTLISCRPQGQGRALWRAVIAVPALDHVPTRVYEIAFGVAVRTTIWMMTQAPTTASRQAVFERLQREAIQPLTQLASGGKSTLPLLREAHARGIPFRSLGGGIYQLGWGAKGRLTDRSTNDRDSAIGLKLSQSKPLTAQALRLAGLPAPTHQVVSSIADARVAAERIGWPVVVKPADLERGEGVSVDVDAVRLEPAFEEAYRQSPTKKVIVERQVDGVCHRLFLASGTLLYAVKRLPIGVYGDGSRTIDALVSAELAAQAVRPPWRRSQMRPLDDLARDAIAAAGLLETSVPEDGRFIALRRIESTAWGGVDEEVTNDIHPENLRVAIAAAALFGLDVAGIDIISPDIAQPWHRTGAIINEINFAPLLGSGEISRRYIGTYLSRLLGGDGRIPVEAFVGGEAAWLAAVERRKALGGDGAGVFVTSAERTLDGDGREIPMSFSSLHRRSRALLLSRQVHALLLVVQDNEFLDVGLPVEYIDRLVEVGTNIRQHRSPAMPVNPEHNKMLRKLLSDRLQ